VLLDENATEKLRDLLSDNAALETVYEFREKLRELWSGASVSNENLLAELKDWCSAAEASGIKVLEEFADRLRSYQMAPA
jgi:stearoyl-CoA desaturase (delta-9 desaturase)